MKYVTYILPCLEDTFDCGDVILMTSKFDSLSQIEELDYVDIMV